MADARFGNAQHYYYDENIYWGDHSRRLEPRSLTALSRAARTAIASTGTSQDIWGRPVPRAYPLRAE
jgi:hypothetical protein